MGFDPGLNVTGYGVIECRGATVRLIEAGTVRSRGESLEDRLHTIHAGVREVLETFRPGAMAIEQVFAHARFPKAALLLAHARGVICLAAVQRELALAQRPQPADAADALAVALTDYHLRLRPLLFGTSIVRIRSSRA